MREYSDSTHYTPFVGDMILIRMLDNGTSSQLPEDFGARLNATNIEAILEQIRAAQAAYHRSHPEDVQEIADLAEEFGFNPDFVVFTGGQQPRAARSYREKPPSSQAPESPEEH